MKQLPRIAARLFCDPWAILPGTHGQITAQFRNYLASGKAAGFPEMDDLDTPPAPPPQPELRGSLAILPVRGIIGKHLSALELMCGGCDGAVIAAQAKRLAADPAITDVIVYLDTPGGECIGAAETAAAIASMSAAGKSVIAYTDTVATSLGYWLASACGAIVAAPSAMVGSISAFIAYLDESRAYEMEGLEVRMFRTGEVKGVGTTGKPWTEPEKAFMQGLADQYGAQFKSYVTARRGLAPEVMQGQYWPAQFAPAGVVDDFADDLEELIVRMVG